MAGGLHICYEYIKILKKREGINSHASSKVKHNKHRTAQYNTAQHNTSQHNTAHHNTSQHSPARSLLPYSVIVLLTPSKGRSHARKEFITP